jgi:hypothetical protein
LPTARKQHGTVRDARGRSVPAVSVRQLARADGDAASDRRRAVALRCSTQVKNAAWRLAAAHAVWIIIAALLWSKFEEDLIGRNAFQGLPRGFAVIAVFAFFITFYVWMANRSSRRLRARIAVRGGFCGSCGYDLMGLQPNDYGNLVCPECGGEWLVRRSHESSAC